MMMIFHVNGFMDFSFVAWRLIHALCLRHTFASDVFHGPFIDVHRIHKYVNKFSLLRLCAHIKRLQSKHSFNVLVLGKSVFAVFAKFRTQHAV